MIKYQCVRKLGTQSEPSFWFILEFTLIYFRQFQLDSIISDKWARYKHKSEASRTNVGGGVSRALLKCFLWLWTERPVSQEELLQLWDGIFFSLLCPGNFSSLRWGKEWRPLSVFSGYSFSWKRKKLNCQDGILAKLEKPSEHLWDSRRFSPG